jgi:hypothetical protein
MVKRLIDLLGLPMIQTQERSIAARLSLTRVQLLDCALQLKGLAFAATSNSPSDASA